MHGFVLMLDNITREFEDESARDQLLHGFTEGSRASLGNLQAAVEMLDDADLDAAMRERFQAVIRDEARAMSRRIQDLAARSTQALNTRWPLEDMLGADLVSAALRRIEALPGAARRAPARSTPRCGSRWTASRCCRRWPTWRRGWSMSTTSSCVELRLSPVGPARPPRPGVDRPVDEHRDRDELGDRADEDRAPSPAR